MGTPHRAILPWARYCRIDPLGLNQNARWTDLHLATGLTGQLRKGQFSCHWSTDQSTLNIHRSHRDPVIPVRPVPGNTRHTGYTGSDQAQPVTPGAPTTPGASVIGNTGTGHTGTRYPVTSGSPGQTKHNRSHRVHWSHRAILPWACYCR